ncbi:hypothetical protein QJS04_geneDACA006791 [Acorus gramineus]|uniref:P21-activated protein kinase-interacting protein 1-like n=1 Tax=Acorus gramineus TaxID=55184 RepID=A0AAV9B0U6_ACOGR|nr:hypothetical protein QJS04_geneDACA006791 [Acorus gramineus]
MTLVAGSYEKFIWGFSLKTSKDQETQEKPFQALKPLFSYPSHNTCIKSIAVSGSVAVSGGADDTIKIYDLHTCSEVGTLVVHNGAINALSFYNLPSSPVSLPCNLLSGADDGTVCIYDTNPFVHLKSIVAHKRGVNDLAIHPSGRLALSVGRDLCLAMLNLVRGRRSFCCRLGGEATIVRYDTEGGKFFMVTEEKVSVHNSEDARLVFEMESQKRILCAVPSENKLLFTSGEDRCITAWDITSGTVAYSIDSAHSARVKGLVVLGNRHGNNTSDSPFLLASASSDGVIRVWDVRMAKKDKPTPLAEASTKSRLTCLAGSSNK